MPRRRHHSASAVRLLRAARRLADECQWEVIGEHPAQAEAVARLIVSGADLPGRCLLRLREREPANDKVEPDERIARRQAASEHVVDVVAAPMARCLRGDEIEAVVLVHGERGSLGELLTRRRGLRVGEAATVLLGVAAGVAALHAAGWARPTLSPDAIVFIGEGCPALSELDAVKACGPAEAVADAEEFHALARTVCLRVADGGGMALLGAVESALRRGSWAGLERAVLAAVEPEPIGFRGEPLVPAPTASRAVQKPAPPRRAAKAGRAVLASLDAAPVRSLGIALRRFVRRRPKLVLAAAVPLTAAVAVLAFVPPSSGGERAEASSASAAGTTSPRASPTGAARARSAASGTQTVSPSKAGEDPVDAARGLLDARLRCFRARESSTACLEPLLDAGAALLPDESAALGDSGAGAARDYTGAALALLERWGDAALVSVVPDAGRTPHSKPASLLVVRSEAGWRLRAVFP